jgi:hypothetical protein
MKKLLVVVFILALACTAVAQKGKSPANKCTTIQSGMLVDSAGNIITLGYDKWGYNYQAHMFNGIWDNYSRPADPVADGDNLEMKWNDAWLSNQDCDGDGKLDRHFGYNSYIGSGAWETNHQSGTYEGLDGKTYHWEYFIKIVAAPADATLVGGMWYTPGGIVIGPAIWGEFAIIQEVYNDSGTGDHGLLYKSPVGPGFGKF